LVAGIVTRATPAARVRALRLTFPLMQSNPEGWELYFGPRPLGRFNALTTSVGKLVFVFENKASVCRSPGLLSTLPSLGR
jgi:hypothetical protein